MLRKFPLQQMLFTRVLSCLHFSAAYDVRFDMLTDMFTPPALRFYIISMPYASAIVRYEKMMLL